MKNSNRKSLLVLSAFVSLVFAVNLLSGCSKNDDNNCQEKFEQGFTAALLGLNPNDPNNPNG